MNVTELVVFIIYFVFMVGIGIYFFAKSKGDNEKDYFLGGRQMGPWVSALSAGASDMSAWVLMGLPASVYALGMGQIWIAVGLAIGYALSWIFEAPRLRKFSIAAKDSITIPQYLTNRFLSKSKFLQIICAIIFLVAYAIYACLEHQGLRHAVQHGHRHGRDYGGDVSGGVHHHRVHLPGRLQRGVLDGLLPGPADAGGAAASRPSSRWRW